MGDDADRIHVTNEIAVIRVGGNVEFCCDSSTGPFVLVNNAHQFAIGQGRVLLCVEAPEVPNANDCCPDLLHGPLLCRRE